MNIEWDNTVVSIEMDNAAMNIE